MNQYACLMSSFNCQVRDAQLKISKFKEVLEVKQNQMNLEAQIEQMTKKYEMVWSYVLLNVSYISIYFT